MREGKTERSIRAGRTTPVPQSYFHGSFSAKRRGSETPLPTRGRTRRNPKQTPSLETEFFGRRLSAAFERKRQTKPQYCYRRPYSATLTLSNVGRSWNRGNRRRSCGLPGGGRSPQKPVCGGRSFRIIPTFAFNVFLRGPKRGFLSIETLVFSMC